MLARSLCSDTIRIILSYGDLGVLAIGLYVNRTFNAEASTLLDEYLTKIDVTKDTIKLICCFDDVKPVVMYYGNAFPDNMARYIWGDRDPIVTYTMYMDQYAILIDYSDEIIIQLTERRVYYNKNIIKEIFYIDELPNELGDYYQVTDKIAIVSAENIVYLLHLNESSYTCQHILHHNGMSMTLGKYRLDHKYVYIDTINKKCITEDNELYEYVELDRPKKLLHN